MVFVLAQIRSRSNILKPWLGIQILGSKKFQELYNDFASGALDSNSEIPSEYNRPRISPSIGDLFVLQFPGKSKKDNMAAIDSSTTLGEATAIVGHFRNW